MRSNHLFLFTGDNYYPQGGMDDLKSIGSNLEEMLVRFKKDIEKGDTFWHVYDIQKNKIVAGSQDRCQRCFSPVGPMNEEQGRCDECQTEVANMTLEKVALFLRDPEIMGVAAFIGEMHRVTGIPEPEFAWRTLEPGELIERGDMLYDCAEGKKEPVWRSITAGEVGRQAPNPDNNLTIRRAVAVKQQTTEGQ